MSTIARELLSLGSQTADRYISARIAHMADDVAQLGTDLHTATAANHTLHAAAQQLLEENADLKRRLEVADNARRAAQTVAGRVWSSYRLAKEQDYEHTHPEDEGEPECPACWVQTIANALGVDQ